MQEHLEAVFSKKHGTKSCKNSSPKSNKPPKQEPNLVRMGRAGRRKVRTLAWRQNLEYLSRLYGFVSSRQPLSRGAKPLLSEEEQRRRIDLRKRW